MCLANRMADEECRAQGKGKGYLPELMIMHCSWILRTYNGLFTEK